MEEDKKNKMRSIGKIEIELLERIIGKLKHNVLKPN